MLAELVRDVFFLKENFVKSVVLSYFFIQGKRLVKKFLNN
jgi:hypothetical protein